MTSIPDYIYFSDIEKYTGQSVLFHIDYEREVDLANGKIATLTCIRTGKNINLPLFQRMVNIAKSVVICDYDGYELPDFGDKTVSFDINFNTDVDCYANLRPGFWLNWRDDKNIYQRILAISPIRKVNVHGRINYMDLPDLDEIRTVANPDTLPSLIEYIRSHPRTKLHLKIMNKLIEC